MPLNVAREIQREIASLPVDFRLVQIRETFVSALEDAGYDLARQVDSKVSAELFTLIAEIDRRLASIDTVVQKQLWRARPC
ncbi:hypothetical protein N4R57_05565 [Rhodobacteraceae bacterium D3-12]|nr:hypothetical protein N4R57_05565 [Rhodobacteraceae bacterium D3-12]